MAAFQKNSQGGELVRQLMASMGMIVPTTIAGATDKKTKQFWQLATDTGQMLAMEDFPWQQFTAEWTITTAVGVSTYALPSDFDGIMPDTGWNHTTRLPVLGGLQEFEWQMLKARLLTGTTYTALFRIVKDQLEFYDVPTDVQTIVISYRSRGWVQDSIDPMVYKDNLEVDADVVLYDPQLFKVALKRAWYTDKRFDTTRLDAMYRKILAAAKASDGASRTLTLGGTTGYPYLNALNIPDTGYGA